MLHTIFKDGWEVYVLLYGLVFYVFFYVLYPAVFRALIGGPSDYTYEGIRHYYRKSSIFRSVFLAPPLEEWWFTYLAYTGFLGFAQHGQEGLVILGVGLFFALLHLPGDLRQINYHIDLKNFRYLLMGQLERLFFSLGAYFIYHWTGEILVTILLHYFYNAVATIVNFDLEDHPYFYLEGDGRLYLLQAMDLGFALLVCYFFYRYHPGLIGYPLSAVVLLIFLYYLKFNTFRREE